MNNRKEKIRNILVPIIAVLLGFVLGGSSWRPSATAQSQGIHKCFWTVFINGQTGGLNARNIGEIFVTAGPLIFTALGFAVANSAGFFNIGLSGQALAGWVSIWVALAMPDAPRLVVLPLAVIVGLYAGRSQLRFLVSYGHSLEQVKSS